MTNIDPYHEGCLGCGLEATVDNKLGLAFDPAVFVDNNGLDLAQPIQANSQPLVGSPPNQAYPHGAAPNQLQWDCNSGDLWSANDGFHGTPDGSLYDFEEGTGAVTRLDHAATLINNSTSTLLEGSNSKQHSTDCKSCDSVGSHRTVIIGQVLYDITVKTPNDTTNIPGFVLFANTKITSTLNNSLNYLVQSEEQYFYDTSSIQTHRLKQNHHFNHAYNCSDFLIECDISVRTHPFDGQAINSTVSMKQDFTIMKIGGNC